MDLREMYERDRRERLGNLAPQKGQGKISEADVFEGRPQKATEDRVRAARRADFVSWHKRAKGAVPDEATVNVFLDGQ
jgi:hypothetical protein